MISEIICVNHIQSLKSHLKNKCRSLWLRHLFSTSTEISHSATWQWGSCTALKESDCLFSFNQHWVSEKKENFPSSLSMFFQAFIVKSCEEQLVIYVPTDAIFLPSSLCKVCSMLRWDLTRTLFCTGKSHFGSDWLKPPTQGGNGNERSVVVIRRELVRWGEWQGTEGGCWSGQKRCPNRGRRRCTNAF